MLIQTERVTYYFLASDAPLQVAVPVLMSAASLGVEG